MNTSQAAPELPAIDKLWNYGDPAGTEAAFRELLAQTEAQAPAAYTLELLTQIARCQGLQDRFDAAHQTLDQVESHLADEPRPRLRYLLERGRAFNSGGQPERALPLFQSAWELGQQAGETRLALDALHMVAIAQPEPKDQIAANLQGIALIERTPAEQGWLPAFLNNLGESYIKAQELDAALAAFRRLDEWTVAQGRPVDIYTRKDIARLLRLLGRTDEALAVIQPVAQGLDDAPDGWIDEELAECLQQAGRSAEALPLFRRAYQALKDDSWVQQHEPAKLVRLKAMSGL